MIGLRRVWKAVSGAGEGRGSPPSTIARDVTAPRPAAADVLQAPLEEEPNETRAAERFVPRRTAAVLTTKAGKRLAARVINVSRTGVAVETELAGVDPADIAMVGNRPVTPGRRIALGMVLLFVKPLDPKLCGPDLVL